MIGKLFHRKGKTKCMKADKSPDPTQQKLYSVLCCTDEMKTRIVADGTPQELNRISGKCVRRKYLNKKDSLSCMMFGRMDEEGLEIIRVNSRGSDRIKPVKSKSNPETCPSSLFSSMCMTVPASKEEENLPTEPKEQTATHQSTY
ncbi:uncharacterized protein FN964_005142 [Alca torda]